MTKRAIMERLDSMNDAQLETLRKTLGIKDQEAISVASSRQFRQEDNLTSIS